MKKDHEGAGFTIVELMIATTVFSIILMIAIFGIINIGRAYYKNITASRTQETTRQIVDDISASLQLTGDSVHFTPAAEPGDTGKLCIGDSRYTFVKDQQITKNNPSAVGLWKETETTCSGNPTPNGVQFLAENMRLLELNVDCENGSDCSVEVRVAYGDNDLLNYYNDAGDTIIDVDGDGAADGRDVEKGFCRLGVSGNQFCSVSGLETNVFRRVQ